MVTTLGLSVKWPYVSNIVFMDAILRDDFHVPNSLVKEVLITYLKLAKLWMGSPKILLVNHFYVGWGRAKYENNFVILSNMHVGLCNVVA